MNTRLLAALSMLGLALSGCATIVNGTTQTLTVNTNVPGAQVSLNNVPIGVTPLIVSLRRGQEGVLSVQAPGYQPFQAPITKRINGIFFANILIGGTFGSTTDYITGAMYAYEPDTYYVTLQPVGMTPVGMQEWRRREQVRAFVLLNNDALATELAAGRGEYVDALVALLEVKQAQRGAAVQRWQASYRASDTAVAFADRMVGELPAPAVQ